MRSLICFGDSSGLPAHSSVPSTPMRPPCGRPFDSGSGTKVAPPTHVKHSLSGNLFQRKASRLSCSAPWRSTRIVTRPLLENSWSCLMALGTEPPRHGPQCVPHSSMTIGWPKKSARFWRPSPFRNSGNVVSTTFWPTLARFCSACAESGTASNSAANANGELLMINSMRACGRAPRGARGGYQEPAAFAPFRGSGDTPPSVGSGGCPVDVPRAAAAKIGRSVVRDRGLDRRRQRRHHFERVANDAVVGDLEDRRFGVFVDRDDRARGAHAGEVLDRAADADGDVELGRDDLAGLADLLAVRAPARVDDGARRADRGDAGAERGDEFLDQLEVLRLLEPAAAGHDDPGFLQRHAV